MGAVSSAVLPTATASLYRIYGLTVASELPLPTAAIEGHEQAPVDVRFRWMGGLAPASASAGEPVASIACERHGTINALRYQGGDGAWLFNRGVAFRIAPDGRQVDVFAHPDADRGEIALLLLGQVAIFVLRALGHDVLHASAVVLEGGAVAFLGEQGAGKSSMAAGFLRRGATLLTDDALPIGWRGDEAIARPSLGLMKLWPQAVAGALDLCEDLPPLAAGVEKRLLDLDRRYALASQPAPLRALYVLRRYDPAAGAPGTISFRPVTGSEAIALLIAQTSWLGLLGARELAASLPAYQRLLRAAPLREIRYPSGFGRQDDVQAAILHDLARL